MNAAKKRQRERRRDPSWKLRHAAHDFEQRLHVALRRCGYEGRLTHGITIRQVARHLRVLGVGVDVVTTEMVG